MTLTCGIVLKRRSHSLEHRGDVSSMHLKTAIVRGQLRTKLVCMSGWFWISAPSNVGLLSCTTGFAIFFLTFSRRSDNIVGGCALQPRTRKQISFVQSREPARWLQRYRVPVIRRPIRQWRQLAASYAKDGHCMAPRPPLPRPAETNV